MSDATAEILRELRAIPCMQQATLHALYSFGGITPNPVPLVAFPVLPAATPDAERQEHIENALRAFGIVPAEAV